MTFLSRRLGPRWFTERFHRNALVTHFEDHQLFSAAGRFEDNAVPCRRLEQRPPQRGDPTDVVAVQIHLVGAHDAHHSFRACGIGESDGRPEESSRRRQPRSRAFRVHQFRGFDSLCEKVNPPIDLTQALTCPVETEPF